MDPLVLTLDGDSAVSTLARELAVSPAEAVERAVRLALLMRHLTLGFHGLAGEANAAS